MIRIQIDPVAFTTSLLAVWLRYLLVWHHHCHSGDFALGAIGGQSREIQKRGYSEKKIDDLLTLALILVMYFLAISSPASPMSVLDIARRREFMTRLGDVINIPRWWCQHFGRIHRRGRCWLDST